MFYFIFKASTGVWSLHPEEAVKSDTPTLVANAVQDPPCAR